MTTSQFHAIFDYLPPKKNSPKTKIARSVTVCVQILWLCQNTNAFVVDLEICLETSLCIEFRSLTECTLGKKISNSLSDLYQLI